MGLFDKLAGKIAEVAADKGADLVQNHGMDILHGAGKVSEAVNGLRDIPLAGGIIGAGLDNTGLSNIMGGIQGINAITSTMQSFGITGGDIQNAISGPNGGPGQQRGGGGPDL